ncbi:hypothetical protein BaRGS_00035194 [Batillaria attramentaria]|uniref:Uncharacterized protein n=1 Tax=Batillaria attramentaria TaxID=370345 RepID=A0ABD0JFB8_9CAEN
MTGFAPSTYNKRATAWNLRTASSVKRRWDWQMESPPPSYEDVTQGGGGFATPDSSSSKHETSAPPLSGEFSHGQHRYIQHAHGQQPYGHHGHGHHSYGQPSSLSASASSSGHGPPRQQAPGAGGAFPQYTYTTVQVGPGYQYSPSQGVNPLNAGYQTTPLVSIHTVTCTGRFCQ